MNWLGPMYYIQMQARHFRDGGGVAMYVRKGIPHTCTRREKNSAVESLWIRLSDSDIVIGAMYRAPSEGEQYFKEMRKNISSATSDSSGFILLGDLNYNYFEQRTREYIKKYLEDKFNCEQMVRSPTRGPSLLDVILTNIPGYLTTLAINRSDSGVTDHHLLITKIPGDLFYCQSCLQIFKGSRGLSIHLARSPCW